MTGWTLLNSRSLLAGWGGADRKRERNHRSIRGSLRGSMDIMLLYQYTCACCQPVIGGLPLQHAQGALLLSCELRRLASAGASAPAPSQVEAALACALDQPAQ